METDYANQVLYSDLPIPPGEYLEEVIKGRFKSYKKHDSAITCSIPECFAANTS